MNLGRKNLSLFPSVSLCFAPRLLLFLLPVTTCCSPRWRTDELSAAVAGTAILSYPFSFYRIIYHQRSRSLLHSAKRPGVTALGRPVPRDLSLSFSFLLSLENISEIRISTVFRDPFSISLSSYLVPFPSSSLIRDGNFITGLERARSVPR